MHTCNYTCKIIFWYYFYLRDLIFLLVPWCTLVAVFCVFYGLWWRPCVRGRCLRFFILPSIESGVTIIGFERCEASEEGRSLRIDAGTITARAAGPYKECSIRYSCLVFIIKYKTVWYNSNTSCFQRVQQNLLGFISVESTGLQEAIPRWHVQQVHTSRHAAIEEGSPR